MNDSARLSSRPAMRLTDAFALARAHHERGQWAEAERLYKIVLKADQNHTATLHGLGRLYLQCGRAEDALKYLRKGINRIPGSAEIHCDLGIAYAALGRHVDAIARFERAVTLRQDFAEAETNLGTSLQSLGKIDEAVIHLEKAISLNPKLAEAHNSLGNVLIAQKRYDEALGYLTQAVALKPNLAEAHNNLGLALVSLRKAKAGIASIERAIGLKPDFADAYNNLGFAYLTLDRHGEAIRPFEKAIALNAGFADAYDNLGVALCGVHRYEDALAYHVRAQALRPGHVETERHIARVLASLGRTDAAIEAFQELLAHNPKDLETYIRLGVTLLEVGRIVEARDVFIRAIAIDPRSATCYRGLADCTKFTADDPYLASMQKLAERATSLPIDEQVELHFALGKALSDVNEHEPSFRHLIEGNSLKRRSIAYDEAGTLALFDRIERAMTDAVMRGHRGIGNPSVTPIFVIGMPRSGTTLVEQIIASHPDAFGAGELLDFGVVVESLGERGESTNSYPEIVSTLSAERIRQLGTDYVAGIAALAPMASRIVDKMPSNFLFAGLIHLALPNARIIHVRRNPIDTCLSCFSNLFTAWQPHTFDLAELGRYYRKYAGLMAHWRAVLPDGVMLEVDYEAVVADLGEQAHRLVAHCGLSWDDACLSFYRTERPVRTASATQVRQPIYKSSVGRWRPLKPLLGPLLENLGGDLSGEIG